MKTQPSKTSPWGTWAERASQMLLTLVLVGAALLLIAHLHLAVTHRYPLDYGEAPLVDQALRLVEGKSLYRRDISAPPYTITNYPPLYVLTLAPGVALFGPNFWFGRAISGLSALAAGVFLALLTYEVSRDRGAAVTTAGVLWAMSYLVHWSALLRIDLLALMLSAAALYVLARAPDTRGGLLGSAALLTAAAYTRQSYALAAPLAAFVWLWSTRGWRRTFALAALVGAGGLLLFGVLNGLTGGGFFFNIVTANVNEFGMERLWRNLESLGRGLPLLLGLGVLAWLLSWAMELPGWRLVGPYLIGAFLSALTIGKIGSNVNYFLELCAALSLVAGVWVAWSRATPRLERRPALRALLLLLLSVQGGWMIRTTINDYLPRLTGRRAASPELRALEEDVAQAEGVVIGDEYMGMVTLQGKPLYVQPFEVTQLAEAGLWDPTALVNDIREQTFARILIHHFPNAEVHKERWTPEMLETIERHYYLSDTAADTYVYRPRVDTRASAPTTPPERCPDAPWRLPGDGSLGVRWDDARLRIFGRGAAGKVPVYAVAAGTLFRPTEWDSAVAILHADPLRPGEQVWSYYGDMRSADGQEVLVNEGFPPGSAGVAVEQGQLLGYQGQWDGAAQRATWTHVEFAVLAAAGDPSAPPPLADAETLSPARYLGLDPTEDAGRGKLTPLRCAE